MGMVEVSRSLLLAPLEAAGGVIQSRHTAPILSHVLLELGDGKLLVTGTDCETQTTVEIAAPDQKEPVRAWALPARKLLDVLRKLPESTHVAIDPRDDARVRIIAESSKFNLRTMPASEFPKLAAAVGTATQAALPQRELRRLLSLTQCAMAEGDIRYYFNGALFSLGADGLVVVAADGVRLALARHALQIDGPAVNVIVPRRAAIELHRLLSDSDAAANLCVQPTCATFSFGQVSLTTHLIDGSYPQYQKVIADCESFTVDRVRLLQALTRAAIICNEKARGVRWTVSENLLRIEAASMTQEEAREEIAVDYVGALIDGGYNCRFLIEAFESAPGDRLAIGFSNGSMQITVPGMSDYRHVIMGMKI